MTETLAKDLKAGRIYILTGKEIKEIKDNIVIRKYFVEIKKK